MKPASSMGDLRRDFDGDDTVVGGLDPWVLRGLVESLEIKVRLNISQNIWFVLCCSSYASCFFLFSKNLKCLLGLGISTFGSVVCLRVEDLEGQGNA